MKTLWVCALLVVMWLIAAPVPALAQTGGGLAGTVRDTSDAVLPGVTVEASSPALIEKVRVVVTDSEGRYNITDLPPGRYMVTFSLPGFTTVKREGIDLVTGFTGNVNAELPVGSLSESITVTGASPVVDVQNTRQQVVVTRDLIDAVPTGKMYQNLAAMIPAVVTSQDDVGGLNGQRINYVTIHGSRTNDGELQLDGSPFYSVTGIGISLAIISDGAFQEVVFDTSSSSAETETGGVRVNLVPRDGGNSFSGGFAVNGSHPSWQANNVTPELRAKGLTDPNKLKRLYTVNPNVGGPIIRDRIWFFANYAKIVTESYVANSYFNSCLDCWEYKPDLTRQAFDDELGRDTSVRLTWQASARNKFTAFFDDNYHCNCHRDIGRPSSLEDREEGTRLGETWLNMYQVSWTFPATRRLLVQAGFSAAPTPANSGNQPHVIAPRIEDSGTGYNYRAYDSESITRANDVNTYRGSVSYVTGSHSVKVGTTTITAKSDRERRQLGNVIYGALNGVPTQVTYYGYPRRNLFWVKPNLGLYAQDQWTINNLTMNLGLRFDYFRNTQPAQTVPAAGFIRNDLSVPFQLGIAWKDLEPRLGVSYDLFGNGKTALKGSVNRYGLRLSFDQAGAISPLFANSSNRRNWTDANGDRVVQGDPYNNAANGELGPSQNLAFGQGAVTAHYDPEYQTGWGMRPANWEVSGGVQQELFPGVGLTATVARRIFLNFPVYENLATPPSAWDQFCVTAPVDARLPNGGGNQLCGIYDLKPAFVGRLDRLLTRSDAFGKQQEHFTAVDMNVSARLRSVLLQGGFTTGKLMKDNCEIVKNAPSSIGVGLGNQGLTGGQGTPRSTWCHTETPFITQVKASGAYTLPWQEIQVSAVYQALPGREILANSTYTRAQVLPILGRNLSTSTARVDLVSPGTMYGARMHQLDLRLAKTVSVGRTRIQGQFDLYNSLNSSPIRSYSGTYGATTGPNTGSAFLTPGEILPARLFKLGMQLTF